MLRAHRFLLLAAAAATAGACAYAPETAAPSWTDAQLSEAPPSQTPQFIPEERLDRAELGAIQGHQRTLIERRDAVQDAAGDVPDVPTDTEDFAERARERARPPESR